jgi:hypothetical protein
VISKSAKSASIEQSITPKETQTKKKLNKRKLYWLKELPPTQTFDEFIDSFENEEEKEEKEEFTPKQLEKIRKMIVKEISNQCCRHTSLVCSNCQ